MARWASRSLDVVFPASCPTHHDPGSGGQIANRPTRVAVGITVEGFRDVLACAAPAVGKDPAGLPALQHAATWIRCPGRPPDPLARKADDSVGFQAPNARGGI